MQFGCALVWTGVVARVLLRLVLLSSLSLVIVKGERVESSLTRANILIVFQVLIFCFVVQ